MPQPSYAILKSYILNDPDGRGYKTMTDAEVTTDMNVLAVAVRQPVISRARIKNYVLAAGKLSGMLAATSPSARLCQIMFTDPDYATINVDDPIFRALLAGLVSESLLNNESDTIAIIALGSVMTSRALQLSGWGVPVQEPDIAAVRGS